MRVQSKCLVKGFICFSLIICVVMIILFINMVSYSDFDLLVLDTSDYEKDIHDEKRAFDALKEDIKVPLIIWWTPFTGERGRVKKCGDVECFFTVDRHYRHHAQTKAFIYYGTDFNALDLPLPRKVGEEWALLHEESPKNLYLLSHEDVISLFNHTATFRRESSLPLTTQYLPSIEWLQDKSYMVTTSEKNRLQKDEGFGMFIYVHSDCDPPSDRDSLVKMIMQHLKVDSYGQCIHNKDLPEFLRDPLEGMEHPQFYTLQAKYKFSLSFENGICNDYVTEKLWRPLMLGSVPVIMGSPKVQDFLPDDHSGILFEDFNSVKEFAEFIKRLNDDDKEYEKYLEWKKTGVTNKYLLDVMAKRKWGINNDMSRPNFIDGLECLVCKRIHENEALKAAGKPAKFYQADQSHYGCPRPKTYNLLGKQVYDEAWGSFWDSAGHLGKALGYFIKSNITFDKTELYNKAYSFRSRDNDRRDLV